MARIAYFADLATGETLEFTERRERNGGQDRYGNPTYRTIPARVAYVGRELFGYIDGQREGFLITRKVEMKAQPTRHACDARCLNATGKVMKCECSCGGKNHGRGAFTCVEA